MAVSALTNGPRVAPVLLTTAAPYFPPPGPLLSSLIVSPPLLRRLDRIGRGRGGVLFTGPPASGKSVLALAWARSLGRPVLAVQGPELLTKYVGETEGRLAALFETARSAAPCVVLLDDVDALAPPRQFDTSASQFADRVLSTLLIELDGLTQHPLLGMFGSPFAMWPPSNCLLGTEHNRINRG